MHIIQSAGGFVYYLRDGEPQYLLIKRHAKSKKIEWVAPKGKLEPWETPEKAAIREISEETGLDPRYLHIGPQVWMTSLRNEHNIKWMMDKDVTYFLVHYKGRPDYVDIEDGGGFTWAYNRFSLQDVLSLVYYSDMRELVRKSYFMIKQTW